MLEPPELDYAAVFRSASTPQLLLDVELIIQDANPAYLRTTGRELQDLIGRHVFEAFPENPDHPDGDGMDNLRASFDHVLNEREQHSMWVQRYDIPGSGDGFREKYWIPINTPIFDDRGELVGILHTAEDVTPFRDDLVRALEFYSAEAETDEGSTDLNERFTDYARVTMTNTRLYTDLVAEVEQLHEALRSRASIEQAKGIVMAIRRCSPGEAFAMLRKMSQDRNVKLRDLAAELVERTVEDVPVSLDGHRSSRSPTSSTG